MKYTIRISESMEREIMKQIREKGFRNKSDFIKNAVHVYMHGDVSPSSDQMNIPKSRVSAQYENLMKRQEDLYQRCCQLEMINAMTFAILFRLTRFTKNKMSEDELDYLLGVITRTADGDTGMSSAVIQRMMHEMIADDKKIVLKNDEKLTVSSFRLDALQKQVCIDAWKRVENAVCSLEEKQMIKREIVFLENVEKDVMMKQLLNEGLRQESTPRGQAFVNGMNAVEHDLYYKAYGKKAPWSSENEPDPYRFIRLWTDAEGRLKDPHSRA